MKKKQIRRFERRAEEQPLTEAGELERNSRNITLLPEGIDLLLKEDFPFLLPTRDVLVESLLDGFLRDNPTRARFISMAMPRDRLVSFAVILWDVAATAMDDVAKGSKYEHLDSFLYYRKYERFNCEVLPEALMHIAGVEEKRRTCVKRCVVKAIINIKMRIRDEAAEAKKLQHSHITGCDLHRDEAAEERDRLRRERAAATRAAKKEEQEAQARARADADHQVAFALPAARYGPQLNPPGLVDAAKQQVAKAASIDAVNSHEKHLASLERLRIENEGQKRENLRISRLIGGS